MNELSKLAKLIKNHNDIDRQIAEIINFPGNIGHVGEYIASKVFDITLENSATNKGFDGRFNAQLNGKTVNIKWYTRDQRLLDITDDPSTDYYLILAGNPDTRCSSMKGKISPWIIQKVYLFDKKSLIKNLENRHIKIGIATSIIKDLWAAAEIYPEQNNLDLIVSTDQKEMLKLFQDDQII